MHTRVILILLILITQIEAKGQSRARTAVYKPGEMLRYQIYYGPFKGGEVLITLEPSEFGGREVLHAKGIGYTTGLADKVFRIYDVYQSFMDPQTGLPVKAIRDISEGSYTYYNEVLYDRDSNMVISQLSGKHEVPPGIMDIVSVIYKLRDTMQTISFRPGDILRMDTYFGDMVYPIEVRYSGSEIINTLMGRFHALKLYPASEPGRMFKNDDDITVWFSNDRNFVPLRVRLNMLVGAVRIDLIEYEGLRYPLVNIK